MQLGILRAALAAGLFGTLVFPPGLWSPLHAQQQPPPKQPPVAVPAPQPGTAKGQPPSQDANGTHEQYSYSVDVPLVTLDVVVADNHGNPITGLKKQHFKVSEDGVVQEVSNFAPAEAPITCVVLVEFSSLWYGIFGYQAVNWAYEFVSRLKQNDWVALEDFDMHTRIDVDFTQDKLAVRDYLSRMMFPGFSESNVFDALIETLDRLQDVKGRKSILLLASGQDTFSKHTLDDTLKRLKKTDVTIFTVGVAEAIRNYLEGHNAMGPLRSLDFLQARNQMNEFARLTGGVAYFPQLEGQIPGIMSEVAAMLRSQYSLGYSPKNRDRDGKFRKIKVELVAPDGGPLTINDQKGKKVKTVIYARQGYTAPKGSVSD